jgi:hypothetical protein
MPRSHRILLIGVAVAALAVLAAPAGAAKKRPKEPKLTAVTATSSATGFPNVATATATCPAGTKAVAGGYTASVPQGSGVGSHWLNVYESQRVGQNAWRASGVEDFADPATDALLVTAYCQKFGKVSVRSASTPLPDAGGQAATTQAACPAGKKLISGGFATRPEDMFGGNIITRSSALSKAAWQVGTTTLSGLQHGSTTAFAYCAKIAKLKLRSTTVAVPAGSPKVATFSPRCPKNTKARGGGFEALPGSVPQTGMLLYDTHREGQTWSTAAIPGGPTVSGSLTAQVLCRA